MGAMPLQPTATRLWKSLPPEERLAAATAFFAQPPPELAGTALGALVKARHLRPQAARSLAPDAQARILATVLDPGEPLCQGLLVSLHLGHRRALLGAFLDALSLPHEDGVLKEEADAAAPVTPAKAKAAVGALASYPAGEVRTYLNTLWLQDPERWGALEGADDWLPTGAERGRARPRLSPGGAGPREGRRPRGGRARSARRGTRRPASSPRRRRAR